MFTVTLVVYLRICSTMCAIQYIGYIFSQPLHHGQDVTQGQFFSGVNLV